MTIIIYSLAFLVPLIVLPGVLENVFNTPKCVAMIAGACFLAFVWLWRVGFGTGVPRISKRLAVIIMMLVGLNAFSLFYTRNPYYTRHSAALHLAGIVIMLGAAVSFRADRGLSRLHWVVTGTGLLVSVEAWLEFFNVFLFFPFMTPGMMVTSTIGNSNYLGAYLLFPLFSCLALMTRPNVPRATLAILAVVFAACFMAFIFSRARASWLAFGLVFPFWAYRTFKGKVSLRLSLAIALVAVTLFFDAYTLVPRFHNMMQPQQVFQSDTLRLRIQKFMGAGVHLWLKNPLFGLGLWGYRNQVYSAQAELNRATDGHWFDNYPEPKPREIHCDLFEVLVDGGILAAIVVGMLIWQALRCRIDSPVVAGAYFAVLAILLSALLFFPFRINSTLMMSSIMMGTLLRQHVNE